MAQDERAELRDHINRCLDLLTIITDPTHRATIADLLAYLRTKQVALDHKD